jgi:hypothetical protein
MRKKSSSQNLNSSRNSENDSKDTIGSTRNYVSGEPAPSSANHKFQNTESNASKGNS